MTMDRLEFPVEYSFDSDSNMVIATIPQLNYISSFGQDFSEAEKNVTEAVLAYLEALEKRCLPIPRIEKNSGTFLIIELVS
jgi:predicted RNase H-like HicB family nuclease